MSNTPVRTALYVVAAKEGDQDAAYKVGVSKKPYDRLVGLQTGSHVPLALRALYWYERPGLAYRDEKFLHAAMDTYRTQGEWFTPEARVVLEAYEEWYSRCVIGDDSTTWQDFIADWGYQPQSYYEPHLTWDVLFTSEVTV